MKVLAATLNKVSNTKMFSIMLDIPTVLLAELRTHRILTQGSLYEHMELDDFNMSANSARAIPISKYIDKVESNPNKWLWTGKQTGMTGSLVTDEQVKVFEKIQKEKLEFNIQKTKELLDAGCHKQHANRGLVEFAHTTCILSGTEWSNLFSLRCPQYITEGKLFYSKKQCLKELEISGSSTGTEFDPNFDWNSINKSSAQPEFQVIAEQIYDLYCEADWKESKYHIPFKEDIDRLYSKDIHQHAIDNSWDKSYEEYKMLISASMCAKLSYDTQENVDTLEKHLERADKLKESKHWEVFSHQAITMNDEDYQSFFKSFRIKTENYKKGQHVIRVTEGGKYQIVQEYGWCYNLRGFISNRYILENL